MQLAHRTIEMHRCHFKKIPLVCNGLVCQDTRHIGWISLQDSSNYLSKFVGLFYPLISKINDVTNMAPLVGELHRRCKRWEKLLTFDISADSLTTKCTSVGSSCLWEGFVYGDGDVGAGFFISVCVVCFPQQAKKRNYGHICFALKKIMAIFASEFVSIYNKFFVSLNKTYPKYQQYMYASKEVQITINTCNSPRELNLMTSNKF